MVATNRDLFARRFAWKMVFAVIIGLLIGLSSLPPLLLVAIVLPANGIMGILVDYLVGDGREKQHRTR